MTHFVVIGLGSIGRRHATNLASLHPDARFTLVRHRGDTDGVADRFGARVVTDLSEVGDDAVDLAVVATPSANHIDVLPALVDRGWPLLVEKPIVTDVGDCRVVEAHLEQAAPAVRAAGFNLRHLPSLRRAQQVVASGELGRVVRASFVAGQWLPDWRPGTDYRESYSADAGRGGGVELDLSHEFDVARWMFGELEVDCSRSAHLSGLEISSNDVAVALLSPRDEPQPLVTVTLDYVSRGRVRRYEVVGERGRLVWDIDGVLELTTSEGCRSLVSDASDHDVGSSYVQMLNGVMHVIATGDDDAVQSLADGLRSTRLALDVRDAGETRGPR